EPSGGGLNEVVELMLRAGVVGSLGARDQMLRNVDLGDRALGNAVAGGGLDRDGLATGAVLSDIGDQPKPGKTRIRIVGVGGGDVAAHSADFGAPDADAVDKALDHLALDAADDPAFQAH